MANTNQVATIARETLISLLPENVPVMKSDKARKYPLYLRFPFGPIPMNTPNAQEFILENGVFEHRENVYSPESENPEKPRETAGAVPVEPVQESPEIPEQENPENPEEVAVDDNARITESEEEKPGFFESLNTFLD